MISVSTADGHSANFVNAKAPDVDSREYSNTDAEKACPEASLAFNHGSMGPSILDVPKQLRIDEESLTRRNHRPIDWRNIL